VSCLRSRVFERMTARAGFDHGSIRSSQTGIESLKEGPRALCGNDEAVPALPCTALSHVNHPPWGAPDPPVHLPDNSVRYDCDQAGRVQSCRSEAVQGCRFRWDRGRRTGRSQDGSGRVDSRNCVPETEDVRRWRGSGGGSPSTPPNGTSTALR
jgi:hypothetical protein